MEPRRRPGEGRLTPFLAVAVFVLAAWTQQEISLSRQSPAIIEAGGYVAYEVTVTNAGDTATGEKTLQARFASTGGKSDSQEEFAVPPLPPGQSKQLHLGPFKVAEAGEHFLYIDAEPADSFVAYGPGTGYAAVVGIALACAGGALVAWHLRRRA